MNYNLFLFLILNINLVYSTTYYIDPNLGNDSWNGNILNGDFEPINCEKDNNINNCTDGPWKTLEKGIYNIGGGDKLYLKSGIYRLKKDIDINGINGSIQNPTIISGMQNHNPRIYLSFNITNWKKYKGDIYYINWTKYIDNWYYKYNIYHKPQMVIINDNPNNPQLLQQLQAHSNTKCNSNYIENINRNLSTMQAGDFYYDTNSEHLYIWLPDNSNPNNHEVEVSGIRRIWFNNVKNIQINNLSFRYSASESAFCSSPLLHTNGENIHMSNLKIEFSDATGLGGTCINCSIKNSYFDTNGNSGLSFRGDHTQIINNTILNSNWRNYNYNWHAGAIKLIPKVNNMIISDNIIENINGNAIWLDNMGSGNIIKRNIIKKVLRNCLFIEITLGTNKNPNKLYHNVVDNCGIRGIYISASNFTYAYNNIILNSNEGVMLGGIPREGYTLKNNLVYNNIIYNTSRPITVAPNNENVSGNFIDYNLYYSKNSQIFKIQRGINHYTLLDWQSEGYDLNSLEINPLFVNSFFYTPEDLKLQNISPAIDNGTTVNLTKDYFGNLIDSFPDIGIHEFQVIISNESINLSKINISENVTVSPPLLNETFNTTNNTSNNTNSDNKLERSSSSHSKNSNSNPNTFSVEQIQNITIDESCIPNYFYNNWSTCLDGKQTQFVEDLNFCSGAFVEERICEFGLSDEENLFLNAKELNLTKTDYKKYLSTLDSNYNEIFYVENKLEHSIFLLKDNNTNGEYFGQYFDTIDNKYYYTLKRVDEGIITILQDEGILNLPIKNEESNFKLIYLFVGFLILLIGVIFYYYIFNKKD